MVDVRMGERLLGPGEFVAGTFVRWLACLSDLEAPRVTMPIEYPICHTTVRFMARNPDADSYGCDHWTHAFSDPASMPKQESFDTDYYDDTHRRWFERPHTALSTV